MTKSSLNWSNINPEDIVVYAERPDPRRNPCMMSMIRLVTYWYLDKRTKGKSTSGKEYRTRAPWLKNYSSGAVYYVSRRHINEYNEKWIDIAETDELCSKVKHAWKVNIPQKDFYSFPNIWKEDEVSQLRNVFIESCCSTLLRWLKRISDRVLVSSFFLLTNAEECLHSFGTALSPLCVTSSEQKGCRSSRNQRTASGLQTRQLVVE